MDIKWSYILIVLIYLVLISIKGINVILRKQFIRDKQFVLIKGFKKDFFTSIAQVCIIVTLIINGMTIIGGRPLNIDSIIITLLIMGMATISGSVTILIEPGVLMSISGYEFKRSDIKALKEKNKSKYNSYELSFQEDINGYENLKLYIFGKYKVVAEEELNKFLEQN